MISGVNKINNHKDNVKFLYNKYLVKGERLFNEKKYMYLLAYLHFFSNIFFIIFPIILLFFNNNFLNKLYLILSFILIIQWFLLEGECYLSYVQKKMVNINYKYGDNYLNIDGYYSLFLNKWFKYNKTHEESLYFMEKIMTILTLLFSITLLRTNLQLLDKIFLFVVLVLLNFMCHKKIKKNMLHLEHNLKDLNNRIYLF